MKRRDILRMSGTAMLSSNGQSAGAKKKVIVIGAGIAGLSCAYELMKRGHDVTVLEASGRYVAFLDSDDKWMSNKLEKQLTFMEAHRGDVRLSCTAFRYVDRVT
jgi:NADPH-dependent 2,4-dienoyl-CoA reductase/sulfur reductase-like enzyme